MNKPRISLLMLALCSLLSYGCANQVIDHSASADLPAPTPLPANPETTIPLTPDYPVRPFATDTLYDLLVGELAGIRKNFDVAQKKYFAQARLTRDPSVVARATQIAAYVENKPVLLEMSLLWTEIEPENLDAHSLCAMSLSQYGRFDEALPHAEFALEHGNNEPLMSLVISANRASKQQRDTLLQHYPKLEAQMPENLFLQLTKAMLLRQQGLLSDALLVISQLLNQDATLQPAIMLKAQLLYQQGNKEEAVTFMEKSLVNAPDNRRMRLQFARYLAEDDLESAHHQLTLLAKKYPNDPELLYSLALASKGLGLRVEALDLFTQLTRFPRTSQSAHYELGDMAEQDNNIESVLIHYRQVLSGPKFIPAAVRLSRFMTNHGQLDDARLYLQKLRLDNPQQSASLYQVESELLAQQQLLDEAYNVLSNAILQEPKNIQLLYMRSLVSERQKNFASSEKDLRAILEQDSDNAMALNALGYTLTVHTDRFEEAHQLIIRALELNPGDPATTDSLGWVSYRLENYEEAIKYLRQAFLKLPDPEVAAHLGEVLWVTGQREEAASIWQKILEQDPDNATIRQTMERLNAE
ncbi:MAG: tetratricopeptide repeat protein [Porticoccus sp.]|nr:tetratricopeptide repeat protein [Porticoccus sp.]